MDDDFGIFAVFLFGFVTFLLFILLAISIDESESDRQENFDRICAELNGEPIDNVCIRDGEIVYKD